MGKDLVDLTFFKDSDEPWGFRLAGGKDFGQPLSISQVSTGSLAAKIGLQPNDFLNSIAGMEVFQMTHEEAERAITLAGNRFNMVIEREQAGRKISFENSAATFALKLSKSSGVVADVQKKEEAFISNVPISEDTPMLVDGSVNFKKYEKKAADITASKTLEKPHQRKDWNCPWVKKDGSGLKQAVRYVEQSLTSAKTSHQHFYSEPRSILAADKELSRAELEALIREHGQESRPESRVSQSNSRPASRAANTVVQEERLERMEVMEQQQETVVTTRSEEQQRVSFAGETYPREREEDSQAPPDLEPVEVQQVSDMGQFGDEGYEPSADELIDVLKNLENLAAANPGLYKAIVEQIKGTTTTEESVMSEQQYSQEMEYQQQMQFQQEQQQEMYQQQLEQQQMEFSGQQEEVMVYEESTSLTQEVREEEEIAMSHQSAALLQQQQQMEAEMQMARQSMSEEEFKQHQKMKRLEAEAQEEVRQTLARQREAKMKAMRAAEPQKPKEITVLAGDGKQVKIQLGGDQNEDSRKQVAEAAGLKHVPLPDFENSDSSAWAGSLKKTPRVKTMAGKGEAESDESPWAGSLRHVKDKPRKSHKHEERDDEKGSAPWMGTLRHVVHDNKVTRNYGVNQQQSKRYPDEDAGNPYESLGGCNAKPAFPLTPAAIINGSVMSRDEMARREEEEEVARIRSNIGSKTVSTALLQVLMPKLLKMHEAKYDPMEKADAEAIMEEILGMQCGLNPDQQADANEEAEMIIRAIMQDEVDKSVYAKMADDLEHAAKKLKKRKVKKVNESPAELTA